MRNPITRKRILMNNDTNCPYCDHPQDINHDDGYGYEEDIIFEQECSNCGKIFIYTTAIMLLYETEKAPCRNGAPCDFQPVKSFPQLFPDHVRCACCGDEIRGEVDESVWDDIRKGT